MSDLGRASAIRGSEAVLLRLWFSPASEVPIYRQLFTQIVLAILSSDLKPGDRLPSTRELARRFSIHPNTVSAGYRQLTEEGWAEYRHGSGVYVKRDATAPSTPEQILDQHIVAFFRAVRDLKLPSEAIRQRVAEWIVAPPPDHFLLVDPDPDAREILLQRNPPSDELACDGYFILKRPPTRRRSLGPFAPIADQARQRLYARSSRWVLS